MSAVAEVLNRAADLIERDGWVQHDYRGPNGERCTSRAIAEAADMHRITGWWHHPTYIAATRALGEVTGTYLVAGWQDRPGRTKAEVVAALRAAAERAA